MSTSCECDVVVEQKIFVRTITIGRLLLNVSKLSS